MQQALKQLNRYSRISLSADRRSNTSGKPCFACSAVGGNKARAFGIKQNLLSPAIRVHSAAVAASSPQQLQVLSRCFRAEALASPQPITAREFVSGRVANSSSSNRSRSILASLGSVTKEQSTRAVIGAAISRASRLRSSLGGICRFKSSDKAQSDGRRRGSSRSGGGSISGGDNTSSSSGGMQVEDVTQQQRGSSGGGSSPPNLPPPTVARLRMSPPSPKVAATAAGALLTPVVDTDGAAAAAVMDVSAGLISRVHCTADGHLAISVDHGVMAVAPMEVTSPPPACPPEICLKVGQRYLAAVLSSVSSGLTEPLRAELLSLLHPEVEVLIGVVGAGPPGRGVAHFLSALRTDNSAYDNWHMTLLSAAAPPAGGEVFLWVDETARNVGPLPGLETPTNCTSRSLTIHRLLLDPAGRIIQAWARYQLFKEMRQLTLVSVPEDMDVEQAPKPQPAAAAAPFVVQQAPPAGGGDGGGGSNAPDLTALPFVQRLMGNVSEVAAAAAGHGIQGEGAAAQMQATYAVITAGVPSSTTAVEAPAGPVGHHQPQLGALAMPAAATATAASTDAECIHPSGPPPPPPPPLPLPTSGPAATEPADPAAAATIATATANAGLVPDFEAQAGRSVATWLGLVDSSYSGVRDLFGALAEELCVWDALGLWPHLRGARGRDKVLADLQHLHAEYDIRIRRGTWAVDRRGRVAFCAWEALAVPLAAAEKGEGSTSADGVGVGGGDTPLPGEPAVTVAAAGPTAAAAAAAAASDGVAAAAEVGAAGGSGSGGRDASGGAPYIFTSLDVYGLSPQGHVTDVVMYRTALPGEAEGIFKKHLLQPQPDAPVLPAAGP